MTMNKLKLGVSREIITPKIGGRLFGYSPDIRSESVNDDLTVTAFYFEQGDIQALMITATVAEIHNDLDLEIRNLIEEKLGIPKDACMLSATHTHSGPCTTKLAGWGDIDREYCDDIFIPQILRAVEKAKLDLKEVTMGVAQGECYAAVNRRNIELSNRVRLAQNPWGVMDPKMTIVSFKDAQNNPHANIIHYAGHGTAAGANHEITRDWSGIMTDRLEFVSKCKTAFFNGPEGDIGPRLSNGETAGGIDYVIENGNIAACDAIKIYNTLFDFHDAGLSVSSKDIHIPLKKRIPLEQAEAIYTKFKGGRENMQEMFCDFAKRVIDSYENGYEEKDYYTFRQVIIKIGNILFVSFPYELFAEIGLRISKEFENISVLSLSDTNGSEGYFITQEATLRESYERECFWYSKVQSYADDSDWHILTQTVEHIKEMNL